MTPSKTFNESLIKNVHRVMLDLLEQTAGHDLKAAMLRAGREEFGPRASADQPHHWLAEQGCLNAERRGESVLAAKLTRSGETSWRPN